MTRWFVSFALLLGILDAQAGHNGVSTTAGEWRLERSNPGPLPPPSPNTFSRMVVVPAGSELVYFMGQAGTRPDGSMPESVAEQMEVALDRVVTMLKANGMGPENVVKVTFYQTEKSNDSERVRARWRELFGAHPPASTLLFVSALARPEYKFEMDVIAARPAQGR